MSALRRLAVALAAAAPLAALGQPAAPPLDLSAPRVLYTASDRVKTDDGALARVEATLTYDPSAGTYEHVVRDADGQVLSRTVRLSTVAGPTPAEEAAAQTLIAAHPDVARAVARTRRPVVVQGGVPLVREGGACGPGSRCMTYDVVERADGEGPARRVYYVIVDLRAGRVIPADPIAEGNLAHPRARRQSRSDLR